VLGCALLGCLALAGPAAAIGLDFSSQPGSLIQFAPDGTIVFEDDVSHSFNDIVITNSDGVGDGVGLVGDIDGIFSMGSILTIMPGLETATVSGTGSLSIADGAGSILTADLVFGDATTLGTGGIFNLNGSINLTNFIYAGANSDLMALAASTDGSITVSFSIENTQSLTELKNGAEQVGNYSGVITGNGEPGSAVPEPTAALCFGAGLIALGSTLRRRARG